MPKIILSLVLAMSFIFSLPKIVMAAGAGDSYGLDTSGKQAQYVTSGSTPDTVYSIIARGISVFLSLLAIVFFGFAVYAGLRWMTARGQEEYVTKAKDTLQGAIMGLVIIVAAYAIAKFVLEKLGA